MKKYFFGLPVFAFLILIVVIGCATTPSSAPTMIKSGFPEGYQDWTNTFSKVVLDKNSPFYGFQRVLVNDSALPAYKKGGDYSEGSMLILEFNEPILEQEKDLVVEIVGGSTSWLAVMKKDSSATKTGGWIFAAYDGKTKALKADVDPVKGCYDCHTAMKSHNYVFSKYQ